MKSGRGGGRGKGGRPEPKAPPDARRCFFFCQGHPNIRARHYKSIEFTRDQDLTRGGTCILGVAADFDAKEVGKLSGRIKIVVEVGDKRDWFTAVINPEFDHPRQMVFRRSRYRSAGTLGWKLNKGAHLLDRDIVQSMKDPSARMRVTLIELDRGPVSETDSETPEK